MYLLQRPSHHQPTFRSNKACLTNGIINWNTFCAILNQKINLNTCLKTPNDTDKAIKNFTQSIQSAGWASSITPPRHQPNSPITPAHVREKIMLKHRARARWQRTRLPSDKNIFNNLTSALKHTLYQLKKMYLFKLKRWISLESNT